MVQGGLDAAIAAVTESGQPYATETRTIDGVDFVVFSNAPVNLRELYRQGLQHADRVFFVYQDERFTYQEAWEEAARVGNQLKHAGIKTGDRVGISLRNYPEWIFAFMGITSIGAVAVAMNAWWSGEEMVYGIEDSGLKLLFADEERIERLRPYDDKLNIQTIAVRCQPEGYIPWDQFVENGSRLMPEEPVPTDTNATILYTSGSTAHPKGVLSSHRAILNALMCWECGGAIGAYMFPQAAAAPTPLYLPATILTVPLFHVTGLVVQFLQSFKPGRKLVAMYKWDADEALGIIERERITSFNGVPTMAWELVQSSAFEKYDLSSLRSAGGGGAAMAPEHARQIDNKLGRGSAGTGWGMTETQGLATGIGGEAFLQRPRSCGRAVPPLVKVKVIDKEGRDLTAGETGELCIWGVMNFREYWNQPEATQSTLVDGWVHTGDIGHMDQEGYVFITDREKDMVIRGGENIGCQEVEAVLYDHPAVIEAAVFGVPDERLGETLATVICVNPDEPVSEDELKAFALDRLAKFKVPDHFWIRTDRLPKIASEKIFKRGLRDEAIELLARTT